MSSICIRFTLDTFCRCITKNRKSPINILQFPIKKLHIINPPALRCRQGEPIVFSVHPQHNQPDTREIAKNASHSDRHAQAFSSRSSSVRSPCAYPARHHFQFPDQQSAHLSKTHRWNDETRPQLHAMPPQCDIPAVQTESGGFSLGRASDQRRYATDIRHDRVVS